MLHNVRIFNGRTLLTTLSCVACFFLSPHDCNFYRGIRYAKQSHATGRVFVLDAKRFRSLHELFPSLAAAFH